MSGMHAARMATIYARSNLRVAIVTPAGFRIRDNYASIDPLIVLENIGDAAVEIRGVFAASSFHLALYATLARYFLMLRDPRGRHD